ncbi:MAG: sigma-70 family RNA polymerase sigma factor [Faecousia sp.]
MMDFQFEQSPWEAYLSSCKNGAAISAWNLISMLEEEDDEAVEDAFRIIQEKQMTLDLSSLPKTVPTGQAALRLKQEKEYAQKGLKPSDMEENDPLRLFLEEIAGIPACADEAILAQRLLSGDEKAAENLTNLGLSRVVQMAAEFAGWNVLLLDLIQEGSVGLWEAIQSYSGGDYAAHRDRMIRSALSRSIILQARSNGISQKMRQALQDYRSTDEKLLMELGRNPSLEEIAQGMKVSREEAECIKKMMDDAMLLNQAEQLVQPKEETPEDNLAVEDTAYFKMRQRIGELLSQLDEQDAKILTLRFGLEKGKPMGAEEVGRMLGLTSGEVSRREAAALAKLRTEK